MHCRRPRCFDIPAAAADGGHADGRAPGDGAPSRHDARPNDARHELPFPASTRHGSRRCTADSDDVCQHAAAAVYGAASPRATLGWQGLCRQCSCVEEELQLQELPMPQAVSGLLGRICTSHESQGTCRPMLLLKPRTKPFKSPPPLFDLISPSLISLSLSCSVGIASALLQVGTATAATASLAAITERTKSSGRQQ
jgi:hypothetical protein